MLLLRRVAPQGFAFGELVYLRSCSRCSFLFSLPPASSFSPSREFLRGSPASRLFTGLHRLPTFYGAPPPPDSLLHDPSHTRCLKIGLHFFRGLSKLWPGDTLCTPESAVSHIPLKGLILKNTPPFFDPLCIGLAKTALRFFSR